jgi:hypothetical protein
MMMVTVDSVAPTHVAVMQNLPRRSPENDYFGFQITKRARSFEFSYGTEGWVDSCRQILAQQDVAQAGAKAITDTRHGPAARNT